MAKTVLDEAIWEKLLEIDKKLGNHSEMQKASNLDDEQVSVKADFQKEKEEIVENLKKYIQGLGTHCDAHFKTIYKNYEQLEKDVGGIYKILTYMSAMLKEQQEQFDAKPDSKKSYLNFKFFKIRKSSIVIAILGLLVLILTVFSMKQQNDYALLNHEFYKQNRINKEMQMEVDSLRSNVNPKTEFKKK